MKDSIPLGKVAGVRIGLHWSVVGIMVLIAVGMGGYQLPHGHPGFGWYAYALGGVVAALLLVFSILAHELAHAIVALRCGVEVSGITLWLLGGVARLRGEADSPRDDFFIAVVGPLTSVILGAIFGLAAWASAESGLVAPVLGYLALLNVVLAVFNMIPAAPLDGGRVLRSVVWAISGSRYQAAVTSARAGRGLGFVLVALGFVRLVSQGFGGLWWVLLGWFIISIASAEENQAKTSMALGGVLVRDVMSSPVDSADPRMTAERFLHEVALERAHATFPLLAASGEFLGLVTLRQLRSLPRQARTTTTLGELAEPPERIATAAPEEPVADVLPRLTETAGGRVAVLSEHRIVGIISPSDIARVVAKHGVHVPLPGGADLSPAPDAGPPPSNWHYTGQQR